MLFLLTLVGRDNDSTDRFYLCWVCLCGILRLEPECQIGEKICIYIEIETSAFGMRASALLQPGCESTWALLSVSAQCVCTWRGGVIKTSDTPRLMGLCWNLGWILLEKFLLGKMEGERSEKAGCGSGNAGKGMEGWLQLVGIENSITCPYPGTSQDGRWAASAEGHVSLPVWDTYPILLGSRHLQPSDLLSSAQPRTWYEPMYLNPSVLILSSEKSFYVL